MCNRFKIANHKKQKVEALLKNIFDDGEDLRSASAFDIHSSSSEQCEEAQMLLINWMCERDEEKMHVNMAKMRRVFSPITHKYNYMMERCSWWWCTEMRTSANYRQQTFQRTFAYQDQNGLLLTVMLGKRENYRCVRMRILTHLKKCISDLWKRWSWNCPVTILNRKWTFWRVAVNSQTFVNLYSICITKCIGTTAFEWLPLNKITNRSFYYQQKCFSSSTLTKYGIFLWIMSENIPV